MDMREKIFEPLDLTYHVVVAALNRRISDEEFDVWWDYIADQILSLMKVKLRRARLAKDEDPELYTFDEGSKAQRSLDAKTLEELGFEVEVE